MTAPALIVAAPRSGAGKTTVTLALLAALRRRGLTVQAAKAGPDYIDPAFHAAATGRQSVNLDSWAMPPAFLDGLVSGAAVKSDILIIEGVMGLFDGIGHEPGRHRGHGRSRGALRRARPARARRGGAIAIGGGAGARLRQPSRRRPHRRRGAEQGRQRPASTARGRRHRALANSHRRRRAARRGDRLSRASSRSRASGRARRSRCAARGACRHGGALPRSRRDPRAGSTTASRPCLRASGVAAARHAHRARARRRFHLPLSACAPGMAAGRRGNRAVLAACRRSAARIVRCVLAPGRLSGAACGAPGRGDRLQVAVLPHSPRRGPCMGSAAATWCWGKGSRTRTACATP